MSHSSSNNWKSPDGTVILQDDEVHIWLIDIEEVINDMDYYNNLLSSDEKERADRFHFEHDKKRHILSCAVLRLLISNYTDIVPEQIQYSYNKFNKPEITHFKGNRLCFNLSHSGNYIIYAFAFNREIGIDIEKNRNMNDSNGIIRRFCSEDEKAEYFSYPDEKRNEIFISCWTRKEAYIKARGEGLSFPLNNFTITINPDKQPVLLNVKDEPDETNRWVFYDINVPDEYYSTLAIEGSESILHYFKWDRGKLHHNKRKDNRLALL